jgi:nickel transport protein
MRSLFHRPAFGALLVSAVPTTALAHAAWIEARQGQMVVVYGHGADDDAYDAAKVTAVAACSATADCAPVTTTVAGGYVTFAPPEGAVAVTLSFDNGFWSRDAGGEWHNVPKTDIAGAVEGGLYLKHSTHLVGHFDGALPPMGHPVEIVPLADPLVMRAGDMLPVQVLMDGQPLPGAEIVGDYVNLPEGTTVTADDQGRAMVPVRNDGLNVLIVFAEGPPPDAALADETGHAAALSFVIHAHTD